MKTRTMVYILGQILFYLILVILPICLIYFVYRGNPITNFFIEKEWYVCVLYIALIAISSVIYLLVMFSIKMNVFDLAWLRLSRWYINQETKLKSEKQKEIGLLKEIKKDKKTSANQYNNDIHDKTD